MVFLVGMPFFAGLANYLTPLMIGSRDMAFPRMNAFGFWIFLLGGILLYFSYIAGEGLAGHGSAPDVGWFAYAPLTERAFSRGTSTDYWIFSIILTGIGTTASAINVIATIVCMRCKRMTLGRMPLFVLLMLVVSSMVLFILPPLTAGQLMLLLDRFLGAHFFDTQAGGSAVLWQHFFWLFGHPQKSCSSLDANNVSAMSRCRSSEESGVWTFSLEADVRQMAGDDRRGKRRKDRHVALLDAWAHHACSSGQRMTAYPPGIYFAVGRPWRSAIRDSRINRQQTPDWFPGRQCMEEKSGSIRPCCFALARKFRLHVLPGLRAVVPLWRNVGHPLHAGRPQRRQLANQRSSGDRSNTNRRPECRR